MEISHNVWVKTEYHINALASVLRTLFICLFFLYENPYKYILKRTCWRLCKLWIYYDLISTLQKWMHKLDNEPLMFLIMSKFGKREWYILMHSEDFRLDLTEKKKKSRKEPCGCTVNKYIYKCIWAGGILEICSLHKTEIQLLWLLLMLRKSKTFIIPC